jgi:hypothetical protein
MNAAQLSMKQLVNLTPHALTLVTASGTPITFQASGKIARLKVIRQIQPQIGVDGEVYDVITPTLGDIDGLPEPVEGIIYVVSSMVAEKAKRADVLSPGELIRDAAGVIVGARGFCSFA